LGLTGTKIVCAEGDCGSCTVLCGRAIDGKFSYLPLDSCIQFVFQLDGTHVITVEGLSRDGRLTVVQRALVDCHGSQCGFCTPGFVMAMTALAAEAPAAAPIAWRTGLTGNLCRCTGYVPILDAGHVIQESASTPLDDLYPPQAMLRAVTGLAAEPFEVLDPSVARSRRAIGPLCLTAALDGLARFPGAVLLAGGTDLGVQINKRKISPAVFIDLNRIPELDMIQQRRDGEACRLLVGARATWTQLAKAIGQQVPELHKLISTFGSPQIRHVGTLGGNLANASPIADSLPFLMVMDAELELLSTRGPRRVQINDFYLGYKQLDMQRDELIARISVPLPQPHETLRLIKVSRRRDLDIATLTAAIRLWIDGETIEQPRIALGGVGPTVIRARMTEDFLSGREFTEDTMRRAGEIACTEIRPISDVRGSAEFRYQLTRNIFLKFFHERAAVAIA
jgi:xanthine dehydrogenase small subunit